MSALLLRQTIKSSVMDYATAVLCVISALVITLLIWSVIQPLASPMFLAASMIAARKSGLKAGIMAVILSGICVDYFFITPQYQLSGGLDDFVRLTVFSVEGSVLCWLITARQKATEEVKKSRELLQAASLRQQTLVEDERKHIALEIHDELGQSLTGLKMETYLLKKQFAATDCVESGQPIETDGRIDSLLNQIDATILSVRRIATELRPAILDDLGVVAAIEWQSQEFRRRTGIACNFSTNVEELKQSSDFSTAIFRIYQEALTNIIRHSEAKNVKVSLKKLDQTLLLRVEDDGKGFNSQIDTGKKSLGIFGMHERARLISGELKVLSLENGGTMVMLTAPLNQI